MTARVHPRLHRRPRALAGAHAVGAHAVGAHAVGAHAVGAHAVGAHAVGAHAVGAHAVGARAGVRVARLATALATMWGAACATAAAPTADPVPREVRARAAGGAEAGTAGTHGDAAPPDASRAGGEGRGAAPAPLVVGLPVPAERVLPDLGPPPPGVRVATTVTEYGVTGASPAEVGRRIGVQGPVIDGERHAGATRWHLRWGYAAAPRADACTLADVVAALDVRVELPRWTSPGPRDAQALRWWTAYRARLVEHESEHVRLALGAAAELRRTLADLRAPTCEALEQQAHAAGDRAVLALRMRQAEFDRVTAHGTRAAPRGAPESAGLVAPVGPVVGVNER